MAKRSAKSEDKKKQPTKSRLSSSLSKKPATNKSKAKPVKKTTKKVTAKKATVSKKSVASKKASASKKTATTAKKAPVKKRATSSAKKKVVATKRVAKKPVKKTQVSKKKTGPRASTKKRAVSKKTASRKKKQSKFEVSLSLTSKTKLTLSIKLAKASKKKKPRAKKTPTKKQLATPIAAIIIGLLGILYFSNQVFATSKTLSAPVDSGPALVIAETETEKSLAPSPAVKLKIPSVSIDASVINVGINPDKSMEVPADYNIVGQYTEAPTPGEIGPAILVGHVDSYLGPAVFWRLRELKPGQNIVIDREDGSTAKFKVTKIKDYSQEKFPTEEVYGNIDHAGLRLITCSGSFSLLSLKYSNNTVVFAELI